MVRRYLFLLLTIQTLHPNIEIRPALIDDLSKIMVLDRAISWEYFKPLFLEYTDLPLAKTPDPILEKDLIADFDMFVEGINQENGKRLYVAVENRILVGFIAFHLEQTNVNIDLVFVDKDYRNKKLGRRLLDRAIDTFKDITTCTLLVLDKNLSARKLYESYGFIQRELPKEIKQQLPEDYSYIYIFYNLDVKKNKER